MDDDLKDMLRAYTVADVDPALLERIVVQTRDSKIIALQQPGRRWLQDAAMIAATGVLGFWVGNATLQSATYDTALQQSSSDDTTLDKVILGPTSLKEVML